VRGVIFVHEVNLEKFQDLDIAVKCLMCQLDFLSDRSPWCLHGYKSQLTYYPFASTSRLVGEIRGGKKACVWQQRRQSWWQAAKLLLVRWESCQMY